MNAKPKTVDRWVQSRGVLDALVAITGQNFGYDYRAWQTWYRNQDGRERRSRRRSRQRLSRINRDASFTQRPNHGHKRKTRLEPLVQCPCPRAKIGGCSSSIFPTCRGRSVGRRRAGNVIDLRIGLANRRQVVLGAFKDIQVDHDDAVGRGLLFAGGPCRTRSSSAAAAGRWRRCLRRA